MNVINHKAAIGLAAILAIGFLPTSLAAQCRLCAAPTANQGNSAAVGQRSELPLNVAITADLNFSRLALLGASGGEVDIDPASGQRRIAGQLTDLGGMSLQGEARVTGEPGRLVRINIPERISLSAPNGSSAEVTRIDTDLPAQARLDRDGKLVFAFGGKLTVSGSANGQFRGRIAITAEYE